MATNAFDNTAGRLDTAMPPEEPGMGGEKSVTALYVYLMEDGSYRAKEVTGEPVPEGAEPLGSLGEVMARTEEYFSAPPPDDEAMTSAKAGYARASKRPQMAAPNPGGIFGE